VVVVDGLLLFAQLDNLTIYGFIQVGDIQVCFLAGRWPCLSSGCDCIMVLMRPGEMRVDKSRACAGIHLVLLLVYKKAFLQTLWEGWRVTDLMVLNS